MANINFVLIFTYGATLILTRFSPKLNPLELLVTAITQNLKMIVNDHSRPDGILLLFNIFYSGTPFTHNGRSSPAASCTHINTTSPTTGPSTTFKSAVHDCGCVACTALQATPHHNDILKTVEARLLTNRQEKQDILPPFRAENK